MLKMSSRSKNNVQIYIYEKFVIKQTKVDVTQKSLINILPE